MKSIVKSNNSFLETFWIYFVRLIGIILFISPLYKPVLSYYIEDKEKVIIQGNDWLLLLFGFGLSSGSKIIGIIVNNIGVVVKKIANKNV